MNKKDLKKELADVKSGISKAADECRNGSRANKEIGVDLTRLQIKVWGLIEKL